MPELPEVETILCGLKPHLKDMVVEKIILRHKMLRWPIPKDLHAKISQQTVSDIARRGKYLLLRFQTGTVIIHLGMSGRLRIMSKTQAIQKHDHVDFILANEKILRYTDPRRFGAVLYTEDHPLDHVLLKSLGVEPLNAEFDAEYLQQKIGNRKIPIKSFIMDSKMVVGVGNIYAAESLFLANIHPSRMASSLTELECKNLVSAIKKVLAAAIKQGGTTLNDFVDAEGKPGYFSQKLNVYGRAGLECTKCGTILQLLMITQRSTVWCPRCQKI